MKSNKSKSIKKLHTNNSYATFAKRLRGRPRSYEPEALWAKAIEYFEWADQNPMYERRAFGSGYETDVPKLRAMTIEGFCNFAGIPKSVFYGYELLNAQYSDVIACIRQVIFQQKFEGASADLLNPNIIARDLGLADRSEVSMSGDKVASSPLNGLPVEKLIAIQKIIDGE